MERHADGKYRRKDGDEVSRTISERTCKREHQKQGKEEAGQGKERTESPLYGELIHKL